MDRRFIFYICRLLFLFSLSSALSASEIMTTSWGNSTTFTLPEEENVVVAILMENTPNGAYLNYRFYVYGREIHTEKLDYTYSPSQWKPLLFISKEVIRSYVWNEYWIPKENLELKGRQVEVSSSHPVKWQVLSLPLNDYDKTEISPNQESPLNLPEHNHVWIALWNKTKSIIIVRFIVFYENLRTSTYYDLNVNEGWSITSISTDIVFYRNRWFYHWVTQPQGRYLWIFTNHQLNLQVFPMPFEPQETSKLPAITTGKYTGTTTIKPQVPPTGNSPVQPEDSPTGIPVSTLIIIGVVAAVLVVVAASFLCYRCCFRKQNDTRAEGIPMEEGHGTVSHPGSAQPNLLHTTENALYGRIVPRKAT